jgi:peptidyl-prolyl cis-trans isomerase C
MEARRLGLDKDPEMLLAQKRILARHLINEEFNKKIAANIEISEEAIRDYYNENQDRYHPQEKMRVHLIFLAANKGNRSRVRARAEDILKAIQKDSSNRKLFMDMARKDSDDEATRNSGGVLGYKTKEELTEQFGSVFSKAAFSLAKLNSISPLVETKKGFYIIRHSGHQNAIEIAFDKVKAQIKTILFSRKKKEAYQAFIEQMEKKARIEIYEDALKKVVHAEETKK